MARVARTEAVLCVGGCVNIFAELTPWRIDRSGNWLTRPLLVTSTTYCVCDTQCSAGSDRDAAHIHASLPLEATRSRTSVGAPLTQGRFSVVQAAKSLQPLLASTSENLLMIAGVKCWQYGASATQRWHPLCSLTHVPRFALMLHSPGSFGPNTPCF